MYKFQHRNCTLSVDGLPNSIELENSVFHITKLEHFHGEVKYYRRFLRDMFNVCVNKGTDFYFVLDAYTISIMPHSNSIFLFDSHSRDERGLFVSNGYSALLKFSSLIQVENYIRVLYLAVTHAYISKQIL